MTSYWQSNVEPDKIVLELSRDQVETLLVALWHGSETLLVEANRSKSQHMYGRLSDIWRRLYAG